MFLSQEVQDELSNLIKSSVRMVLKENQPETVKPTDQPEKLFSIQEAGAFLNLSVPTIYSKVSKNELPFMKRGKRLYFSSSELLAYLKEGRKKSVAEIEAEAELFLSNKKG